MHPEQSINKETTMKSIYNLVGILLFVGFYYPVNAQDTWERISNSYDVRTIVANTQGKLFVATSGSFLASTDYGNHWDTLNFPDPLISDFFSMVVTPDSGHIIVAAEPGLFRSKDEGLTWTPLDTITGGPYSLAVDAEGRLFASGSAGLFRSTDNGYIWTKVNSISGSFNDGILCASDSQVYASSIVGGLIRSNDTGITWDTVMGIPTDTGLVVSMTYNPLTGTILVGLLIISNTKTDSRIYRSTDAGETWDKINFIDIIIDALFTNSDGTIYAGSLKIYRSTDDGLTWEPFNNGIEEDSQIQSFGKQDSVIFAGNRSFGLYKLSGLPNGIEEMNKPNNLTSICRNYPNPFSENTTIQFETYYTQPVQVSIINTLGQVIQTWDFEELKPSRHDILWEPQSIKEGIYFCRLQLGSKTESFKIVYRK